MYYFRINKSEVLYCCKSLAKPILHDTIVQLSIEREILCNPQSRHHSLSNLLDDDDDEDNFSKHSLDDLDTYCNENIQVTSNVLSTIKFL